MKYVLACALASVVACSGGADNAVCGDQQCTGGETADSCAADCGCGNGVVNLAEQCDGPDLGTATCESVAQRGGTLRCNADCTFDVVGCDEYMCGNGIAEPGEDCDGSDVAGATCESAGFSGGPIGCTADCRLDAAGCCNNFCDTANSSVCAGDSVRACVMQANGCLGLEITDCAADDDVCDETSGVASCMCVDRCAVEGIGHCTGALAETCAMQADGCLAWSTDADCSTAGKACAVGPQGSTCTAIASGEDCADPYPLEQGQNVIAWTATTADYLTSNPSCNSSSMTGGDVVLAYTATVDGIVTYSMDKLASQRHVIVVSNAACGTLPAASQVSCAGTEFYSATAMGDTFAVTQGATYYFYVRDTTSGSATLPSPIALELDEAACTSLTNTTSNLSPANGAVLETLNPVLTLDLEHPIKQDVGVITITGNLGTNRSFDLATSPSQVTFTNGGRAIRIDPTVSFMPGETITVSWSGVVDKFCSAPIPAPTWTFSILTPSCSPGVAGMVGTTQTRVPTNIGSFTEYYVHADSNPNGYVYVGGTGDLFRLPKSGGAFEDVLEAADTTSTPLGYSMAFAGGKIFTLDTVTSTTAPAVWRLSTSGGVTWNTLGYGQYSMVPGASAYSMWHDAATNRIYIATRETTSGAATEIWSVSASAVSLPAPMMREGTFAEKYCSGLTGDAHYFYLTCADANDDIIRVDRMTFQTEVITSAIPLSLTKNDLHAHDFNNDGTADALYVKGDDETVHYVCGPGGAAPFWHDILVSFGSATTTSNYGLGFDPVANVLWAYDDDTQELISIQ